MKNNRQKDQADFSPDSLGELPMTIARYALWGGVTVFALCLIAVTFLMNVAANDAAKAAQVATNMGMFEKGLILGPILIALGSAWLFWEEEMMVGLNIVFALVVFFAPMWLPLVLTNAQPETSNPGVRKGYESLAIGGQIYVGFAIAILIGDIVTRVRKRMVYGTKAALLKYGTNIKEESDRKNVFMGKCWQLPFCRKFVREKCPIYHANRTCWRELVGCMCEEAVISAAMTGKPVSKEALLNGTAIPRNNKLTDSQKRQRCHNCVIYNEHQKHKYKLAMPLAMIFYGIVFLLFRESLGGWVSGMMTGASKKVNEITVGTVKTVGAGEYFNQFLTVAIILVAFAYTVKLIEHAIFKLKI
jgi:hypothetical protein